MQNEIFIAFMVGWAAAIGFSIIRKNRLYYKMQIKRIRK